MPIRFRCGYCNRLLGIARRKAGSETTCPHCGYTLTVPDDPVGDTTEMEDLDELLNPMTSPLPPTRAPAAERSSPVSQSKVHTKEPVSNGSSSAPAAPPSSSAPPSKRPTKTTPTAADPRSPVERPLFERNVEDVLGTHRPIDEERAAKPKNVPTTGMDASSLVDDRSSIVLSVQKATVLAILAVILIGISFAAGYILASTK
jgi:hypothetical protein